PGCDATFRAANLLSDGDLPETSFDAIVCFSVLEPIEASDAAARSLARALAPEGTLVAGYPMVAPVMSLAFEWIGSRGIGNHLVSRPAKLAEALRRVLNPAARVAFPPHAPISLALYQCSAWRR